VLLVDVFPQRFPNLHADVVDVVAALSRASRVDEREVFESFQRGCHTDSVMLGLFVGVLEIFRAVAEHLDVVLE
jgi:hypothetical protein